MNNLESKIQHYALLSKEIEKKIEENELNQAGKLLEDYSAEVENSAKYCYKAILVFQKGNVNGAIDELMNGAKEHPFSFNIHYNLGFMYDSIGEYESALESFFNAVKFKTNEDEKEQALTEIKRMMNEYRQKNPEASATSKNTIEELKKKLMRQDARVYPIDINGDSIIRKVQLEDTAHEFMVNMYNSYNIIDVDLVSRMHFKSELIKGKRLRTERIIRTTTPVVIPVSVIDHSAEITIKVNDESYQFLEGKLVIQQIHYIRIDEPGEIEFSSDAEIFIGNPIEIGEKNQPIKLSLKIFIDGLSYQFLEDNGLQTIMPNTYQFFTKGFIASNCFTTSEWTLPSKASINTGLYATNHRMLQPNHLFTFYDSQKLLAEFFQAQGYYCTNICTNWRTTPALGYYKGFDRMIYQNFGGGMDAKEVVMETIEHLMAFASTNKFMTISLMDLHNVSDEIENHLYSQANTGISKRINKNLKGTTSVQTKYDEHKIIKYFYEIKRVDGILGILYDYILKNYSEEEFVITLHSDHGQSFLEDDFNLLSDNRLKVPFMMRGRNVPIGQSDELIETVDILPAILECCELEPPIDIDGQLPKVFGGSQERSYTFTQIIHPNQPYKALIKEESLSYYLETKHPVLDDLTICLYDYKSYIIDIESGLDITKQNADKLNQYDEIVFNNIKNMLRWSH